MANVTVGAGKDYTTINAAIAAANVDDTIVIDNDTYSEKVDVTKNLTLRAADTVTPAVIINGDGVTGAFVITRGTGVNTFTNIEFDYSAAPSTGITLLGTSGTILFDTCTFTVDVNVASGISVSASKDSISFDTCAINVTSDFTDASYPVFIRISSSVPTPLMFDTCAISYSGGTYNGLVIASSTEATSVIDCTISYDALAVAAAADGFIMVNGGFLTSTGNTVTASGAANVAPFINMTATRTGYLIDDNTITNAATGGTMIRDIASAYSSASRKISNNIVMLSAQVGGYVFNIGGDGTAVTPAKYADDCIIEKNYIKYTGVLGAMTNLHTIIFGNSLRGIIRNNVIMNCNYGAIIKGGVAASGYIYGNTIINTTGTDPSAILCKGVDWAYVTNNTIYSSSATTAHDIIDITSNLDTGTKLASNVKVKNNIIYIDDSATFVSYMRVYTNCEVGFESDYNIFFGQSDMATGSYFIYNSVATTESLATWQARLLDVSSLTTDPVFIDFVNCIPCSTSSAIGLADTNAAPSTLKQLSPLSRYADGQFFTIDGIGNAGAVRYVGNDGMR